MKIAICQTDIMFEDYEANLENMKNMVEKTSLESDLVLFPEMSLTGFSMNTSVIGENNFRSISNVKKLAIDNKVAIGFGWVETDSANETKSKNHYSVIDENGTVIADYVKIHPFSYSGEDEHFEGGNSPSTFCYKGVNLGITICYDLRFPELFQAESKRADIIIVPANWPAKREEHWNVLLKARAIENQVYIVAVNCAGNMDGQYYKGDSQVITPEGNVVKKISDEQSIQIVELGDVRENVEKVRNSFPIKNDRKEELYGTWYRH